MSIILANESLWLLNSGSVLSFKEKEHLKKFDWNQLWWKEIQRVFGNLFLCWNINQKSFLKREFKFKIWPDAHLEVAVAVVAALVEEGNYKIRITCYLRGHFVISWYQQFIWSLILDLESCDLRSRMLWSCDCLPGRRTGTSSGRGSPGAATRWPRGAAPRRSGR